MSWIITAMPKLDIFAPLRGPQVGDYIRFLVPYVYRDGDRARKMAWNEDAHWEERGPTAKTRNPDIAQNLTSDRDPWVILEVDVDGDPNRVRIKEDRSDLEAVVFLEKGKYEVVK